MMENSAIQHYSNIPYLGCASHYIEEINDNLEQYRLLKQFNHQELSLLLRYLHCFAAPRGYTLFEKGDLADHLIIVMSGEVKISENTNATPDQCKQFGVGTTIGSDAFIESHKWDVSCIAHKPTDFAVFSKASLNEILMHSPRLGNQLLLAMMQSMAVKIRTFQQDAGQDSELLLN